MRAEAAGDDGDVAFVCLWIAFNAVYAQDLDTGTGTGGTSERQAFRNFMADVCAFDKGSALTALVWQVFPGPIRVLLGNQYVFQPFWDVLNNPRSAMTASPILGARRSTIPGNSCIAPCAARCGTGAVRGIRAPLHAALPVCVLRYHVPYKTTKSPTDAL